MYTRWFLDSQPLVLPQQASQGHRAIMSASVEEIVESRSGGDPHQVRCRNGAWSCSCPAYTKGSKECWALKLVRAEHLTLVNSAGSLAGGGGTR